MTSRKASLRAAQRTTRELGQLFAHLGSAQHPRGAILTAYRNARRATQDVLRRQAVYMLPEMAEVLGGLRETVRGVAEETLLQATILGQRQAEIEARVWGLDAQSPAVNTLAMVAAWVGVVEQQERAILAILATGADPALILGSPTAVGLLRPAPVTREGDHWLAVAVGLALLSCLRPAEQQPATGWGKQAVASIDQDRTTPCCLAVHGQVVPLEQKFHTSERPAYADWQEWAPFHDFCRTSIVLVPLSEAEDDLTAEMLTCAREEQARRAEEKK
jgi:hypothetical protein